MNSLDKAEKFLTGNTASVAKDQFFCVDEAVLDKIIETADITPRDRILEIGPGLGCLTEKLAARAKEVVAIEIDKRFRPYLAELPENVEVIYGNAYELLNTASFREQTQPPTKVISNIPYSRAQNMLHNYTNYYDWYQGDLVWLAPLSLAEKVNREPMQNAYFHAEVIMKVPPSAFMPKPNTTSAIIYFHRIPDPVKTGDFAIFMRRWFYDHEHIRVKNMLREGIIAAAYKLKRANITKNEARKLVESLKIPEVELELLTNNIPLKYYFEIPAKLQVWFEQLPATS